MEQLLLQHAWSHLKNIAANHSVITVPQRIDNVMQLIIRSISSLPYPEEAVGDTDDHPDGSSVVVEGPAGDEALVDLVYQLALLPLCLKVIST